jgi:hypothetical protein
MQALPWGGPANDAVVAPSASAPAIPSAAASFIIDVFMAILHFSAGADRHAGVSTKQAERVTARTQRRYDEEALL